MLTRRVIRAGWVATSSRGGACRRKGVACRGGGCGTEEEKAREQEECTLCNKTPQGDSWRGSAPKLSSILQQLCLTFPAKCGILASGKQAQFVRVSRRWQSLMQLANREILSSCHASLLPSSPIAPDNLQVPELKLFGFVETCDHVLVG